MDSNDRVMVLMESSEMLGLHLEFYYGIFGFLGRVPGKD
jgi:hypothetical protein